MIFLELAKCRHSVRRYSEQSVERAKIARFVEAARFAPSACNSQPWEFVVVDEPDLKNAVAKAAFGKVLSFNKFALEAPVIVAVVCGKSKAFARFGGVVKRKRYDLIDIGIAAEHFCLAATEEGIGTCIMGWFDERKVKRLLKVSAGKRVILLITVGYEADGSVKEKTRKKLSEILRYNIP